MVQPKTLAMTAVSNFRSIGSFSVTKARTPTFWRPTALSMPEAVGKSRGAGAPSMGSRDRPLVTKPPRRFRSTRWANSGAVDLSVKIGALRLRNPILAASGTFGYGLEFAHLVDLNRLGGFVTKGLSRELIEGAPAPRLFPTASGMLNAVGLQNVGVRAFVAEKLPVLRKFDTAVIANVFGCTIEDYV